MIEKSCWQNILIKSKRAKRDPSTFEILAAKPFSFWLNLAFFMDQ